MFAVLVLTMGVAPLVAWRKQSVARLGRQAWLPFGIALALVLALFLLAQIEQEVEARF